MCCGNTFSRSTSIPAKQSEPVPPPVNLTVKQADTSNPVNNVSPNNTNITRANEARRNQYHLNHFGGR